MRRQIITWSIIGALIVAAFLGTVLVLNATLYSASGFARSYLDALARHDADGALELAGASVVGDASAELLVPDGMGELSDIRLLGDTENEDGSHTIEFAYLAGGTSGTTTFEVQRRGSLLGLFPTWVFATSPLGIIHMTVLHADDFTGNGVDLVTPTQNDPAPYLVFTPGLYTFDHESTFLTADAVDVAVTAPAEAVPAALKVEANERFLRDAQQEVDDYLDECATQEVLLPTNCPFGQPINNRIATTPVWSIASYPQITIEGAEEPNQWLIPPTEGAAHLVVDVRSLFDGSITTFDEDVPFGVSYIVTFLPEDELLLTARF